MTEEEKRDEDKVLYLLNNLTEKEKESLVDEIAEESAKKRLKFVYTLDAVLITIALVITAYFWTTGYFCHYTIDLATIGNQTGYMVNFTHIGGMP